MSTYRSRGIDTIVVWLSGMFRWTNMIVSDRLASPGVEWPNSDCCCLDRPARLSLPSTRQLQLFVKHFGSGGSCKHDRGLHFTPGGSTIILFNPLSILWMA